MLRPGKSIRPVRVTATMNGDSAIVKREMPVRPRLLDVARLCGVTPATVSRVLNGKKSFSTSDAVRENILATASRLGYVPDLAARNLNRRQTRMIGLFSSPATHVGEGINDSLLDGISGVLHSNGYDVFFEIAGNSRSHPALPAFRFDAAVLLQAPRTDTITELDRRRVPYVCVNERAGQPVASVLADDAMGMRRAVEHLAHLGHRRIGYANAVTGYFAHHSISERYETLASAAQELGLELAPGHEVPFSSAGEFLDTCFRRGRATAIIAYDHRIAVALMGAAYSSGLRIPTDFSLLCFNDVFPTSLLSPALTAVAVCGREMGRIGAEMLLNCLANPASVVADRVIRVPEDLVVRGSTAPVRTA